MSRSLTEQELLIYELGEMSMIKLDDSWVFDLTRVLADDDGTLEIHALHYTSGVTDLDIELTLLLKDGNHFAMAEYYSPLFTEKSFVDWANSLPHWKVFNENPPLAAVTVVNRDLLTCISTVLAEYVNMRDQLSQFYGQ